MQETTRHLDAFAYLPPKGIFEYRRDRPIYDEQRHSAGLSLIIRGRVKLTTTMEGGAQTVIGIFRENEFFGAVSLLGGQFREQATALDDTAVMTWTREEVEAQIERHPRLGISLIQVFVARCQDFGGRIQSLALDKMAERLGLSLIRFAKSGTPEPEGWVRIPPLTHEVLSRYIGTSREIVTTQLGQYRRLGLVRYSRKAIHVYPEALAEHIRKADRND